MKTNTYKTIQSIQKQRFFYWAGIRILIIFLFAILCLYKAHAQDVIFKKNGEELTVQVIEIEINTVKYKKFDFQQGPTYTIQKVDILMIKYANGSKDIFDTPPLPTPTSSPANPTNGFVATTSTSSVLESTPKPPKPSESERVQNNPPPIHRADKRRAIIAYFPSLSAPLGLMIGYTSPRHSKSIGFYVSGQTNLSFKSASYEKIGSDGRITNNVFDYKYTGETSNSRGNICLGILARTGRFVHFYLGGGYGWKKLLWEIDTYYSSGGFYDSRWATYENYSASGFESMTGILLDFGGFNLSTGITNLNFEYWDANLGIGFSF